MTDNQRNSPLEPAFVSAGVGQPIGGRSCIKCPGKHPHRGGGMFSNAAGQRNWYCAGCKAKRMAVPK